MGELARSQPRRHLERDWLSQGMAERGAAAAVGGTSTAEMAIEAMPGRPRLRMAWTMAAQQPGMSIALWPCTTFASMSLTNRAVAVSA